MLHVNIIPCNNLTVTYCLIEYPLDMAIRDDGITDRLRINSKDYDVAEASICSNISSLSPEDHYYLTSNNSSVVAGTVYYILQCRHIVYDILLLNFKHFV